MRPGNRARPPACPPVWPSTRHPDCTRAHQEGKQGGAGLAACPRQRTTKWPEHCLVCRPVVLAQCAAVLAQCWPTVFHPWPDRCSATLSPLSPSLSGGELRTAAYRRHSPACHTTDWNSISELNYGVILEATLSYTLKVKVMQ